VETSAKFTYLLDSDALAEAKILTQVAKVINAVLDGHVTRELFPVLMSFRQFEKEISLRSALLRQSAEERRLIPFRNYLREWEKQAARFSEAQQQPSGGVSRSKSSSSSSSSIRAKKMSGTLEEEKSRAIADIIDSTDDITGAVRTIIQKHSVSGWKDVALMCEQVAKAVHSQVVCHFDRYIERRERHKNDDNFVVELDEILASPAAAEPLADQQDLDEVVVQREREKVRKKERKRERERERERKREKERDRQKEKERQRARD
jgi:hypothetical protein